MDARRAGHEVHHFPSRSALGRYTMKTGKIFPKQQAKDDGFVKALLVDVFH